MAEVKVRVEPTMDIEGTAYQVLRYELDEGLSRQSTLSCAITRLDEEPPSPGELVGKTAVLTLAKSDGSQTREFAGRIVSVERSARSDDVRTLELTAAPAPWRLHKRADCRVFQQKNIVDIAKEVLEGAGVVGDRHEWRISATHPVRTYVVQYRETDLQFLQRLLSEEGIYWAVHHAEGKDTMIFGDDPTGLGDVQEPKALPFHHGHGHEEAVDKVTRLAKAHQVTTDKVMLRDYNPDKPKLELEATVESESDGPHALERYDYPARCQEPAEAKRLAQIVLDELGAGREVVRGEAGVLTLFPGLRFSVEQHPYAPLNQEYMVTSVRIVGSTPRLGAGTRGDRLRSEEATGADAAADVYRYYFTAVPTSVRYAPPMIPRAADIVGLQTAFTTGPSGEEIHVSESGQAKIRYHWDRLGPTDDTSSLWVRTSQLALGDSMFLPRVKWEVTVDHLDGDPDGPFVMGRMYNAHAPPPYELPGEAARSSIQTATSPGGGTVNEIRMSDGAGSEEMFFNASKDMSVTVKNNTTESVGANSTRSVGSSQTREITDSITATVGGSQSLSVAGNQSIKVETRFQDEIGGDHTLSIGGNRTMNVGGDHKLDVGGDSTLEVGGNQIDLVVGSVTNDTLADHTHKVGAAIVDITPASYALLVGGNMTETAGAVKVIAVKGGRGVEVGGTMMTKVAGAIINVANGDHTEQSGATYTEIAAGAHLVKAANIVFEAESLLSVVMGASMITLTPASCSIMGASVKFDGATADLATLILDN